MIPNIDVNENVFIVFLFLFASGLLKKKKRPLQSQNRHIMVIGSDSISVYNSVPLVNAIANKLVQPVEILT
jgi:hypothetical protein